jgi:hypothetical protein
MLYLNIVWIDHFLYVGRHVVFRKNKPFLKLDIKEGGTCPHGFVRKSWSQSLHSLSQSAVFTVYIHLGSVLLTGGNMKLSKYGFTKRRKHSKNSALLSVIYYYHSCLERAGIARRYSDELWIVRTGIDSLQCSAWLWGPPTLLFFPRG